jgi:UDP-N-acetylenolpyruvoylglucosamine reductase
LLDVYPAGEAPVAGGTAADIYAEMRRCAPALSVDYFPGGHSGLFAGLAREARRADLVAFVGAGDIDREARAWIGLARGAAAGVRKWDERADGLRSQLSRESRVTREEPLGPKTTLRVGGAARIYAEPADSPDLAKVLRCALELGIPALILGRGSNLIVPDAGVDGVVVSLSHEAWSRFEALPDGRVRAGAGLRLKNLCGLAASSGLSGFEFLEGIPGSVGGALRMNAGAMGGWIFDLVEEVQLMTMAGEAKVLRRAEMRFDYRRCSDLQDAVALGAVLRAPGKESAEAIARRIDAFRRKRHETQPREPSAGCIFKNPPGDFAGRLIEECGLKGERAGNAEVSPVHANFIINRGGATSADVLELIRRVRGRVRNARGVDLEPEVLLYGARWEDVL